MASKASFNPFSPPSLHCGWAINNNDISYKNTECNNNYNTCTCTCTDALTKLMIAKNTSAK